MSFHADLKVVPTVVDERVTANITYDPPAQWYGNGQGGFETTRYLRVVYRVRMVPRSYTGLFRSVVGVRSLGARQGLV